ncbi:DUF5677 domain-containing protein [Streptococcus constellatus]|uniref:DUF5677 domain-containing protein n=1 Tax=Streptococcus constellatus TaxID=76860 RepID=UPI00189A3E66|nr:DUF5677 domain-containing protein [Streptococcus constellatus]
MFSKLSEHDLIKGVFKSKFSQMMTPLNKESDWLHSKGPEYMWIGLVLYSGSRTDNMEKIMMFLTKLSEVVDTENNMSFPTISALLNLNDVDKIKIIDIMKLYFDLSEFSPLTIVLPDDEKVLTNSFYSRNDIFETRLNKLTKLLDEITDQYSQLSTDIRYFILYYKMLQGKLHFIDSESQMMDALKVYPYLEEGTSEIGLIGSQIRAMEIAISLTEDIDYSFSSLFWDNISQLTDCEVFSVTINKENNVDLQEIKREVYLVLQYYRDLLQNIEHFNDKLYVLTSILTYSYKRLLELINHELQYTISGRSIVRSCIENYVMTKYLIAEEDFHENIWEEYQYYGIGGYKLISERYIENSPELAPSHVNFQYLNLLVSEFIDKEFIDMDTRYFGAGNIKRKFEKVGEKDLYSYQYDYDSQFEHGLWGAIRESSILKCDSPGHQFHGIPDIDDVQELPDVSSDIEMVLKKHLSVLKEIFPIPNEETNGGGIC